MINQKRTGGYLPKDNPKLEIAVLEIFTQVTAHVNNANEGNGNGGNNGCSYKTFTAGNPKEYDGKGGAVALTRWIEKMDSVFDNSGCITNQRVRYAASCFVNKALTWWNTQVQARGRKAAIGMSWNDFRALLVEELCPSNEIEKLENEFWNHTMVGANHVTYTDRFHELVKLVPHLVTPESSRIKRYINGLAPQIHGILRVTQPTTIQSAILTAGILTDEAVCYGTLTKGNDKRKEMEESSKQGSTGKDNKKSKNGSRFVATVPPKNDNVSTYPKCARCYTFHPENAPCKLCYNCQKLGHYARQCWAPIRQVAPVNAVRMGQNQRASDFSFISTKFAPLLNVEPCIVNPGYVIEIADGESVEVDRIIRDCKLELGNSLFTIDLIPLGHESFDVVVGMDLLSKNKAVIVCHEKVVEIPIKEGGILRVHRECTLGVAKALMNAKIDEPRISDILVTKEATMKFTLKLVLELLTERRSCMQSFSKGEGGLSEVRSFLGLAGYYRRFIANFCKIAKPLTSLTQKNQKYEWCEKEEEAFQALKNNLCDAPILSLLDEIEDFVVYCDASNQGLGCCPAKEARRWIELFSDYECEIRYHSGKANVVVDALSRKEWVKPRRVRAMAMSIQSGVKRDDIGSPNLHSSVDIEKSHEDPHSSHNKDIVVENLVKFVENNQSFDWNTGPDCRQTGLEVDNHSHDGHRSHITHKSMARIGVVEGGLQNLENR
ncbi:putative reverse transcriptase domain-containing protein [Tanacetum coccineum]